MDNYQELLSSLPLCIKRGPYIKYKQFHDTIQKIMMILKTNVKAEISIISLKTGFKLRTLYNWKERLLKDKEVNHASCKKVQCFSIQFLIYYIFNLREKAQSIQFFLLLLTKFE